MSSARRRNRLRTVARARVRDRVKNVNWSAARSAARAQKTTIHLTPSPNGSCERPRLIERDAAAADAVRLG